MTGEESAPRPSGAQVDRYSVYRLAGLLAVEGELHDGIAPGVVDSRGRFHDLTLRPAAAQAVGQMVVMWDAEPARVVFLGDVPAHLTGALEQLFLGDWQVYA